MEYGAIAGLAQPVSRLILGTMVCTTDAMEPTCALLDAWVAAGGNCVDMAYVYAGGKSEVAVGLWMQARGNRQQMVLVDKGAHPKGDSGPRVRPDCIAADLEESLERLQTGWIDLYLLHRDDPDYPVGPIVDCLNAHKEAGRIRAFGGSNWTYARLAEANAYADAHGLTGFAASSPYFGLAAPNEPMWAGCVFLDATAHAWHERTQMPLLPWSSQASGFFTGRYTPEDRSHADVARVYYNAGNWERLERARELAAEKGCSTNQAALAYVLHRPFPVFPLVGPRTPAEMEDTLGALSVRLAPDEVRRLEGDRW